VTAGPDTLYFSSTRPDGFSDEPDGVLSGDADVYASPLTSSGFGPAVLVPGINTAANDARPNVRHDGLELVFDSDRPGGLGGTDIYVSFRHRVRRPWSTPINLGAAINSPSAESRASLSWDGRTLVFGSNRPESEAGSSDIYIARRSRT
jgi:Tol biopolymer transport system component